MLATTPASWTGIRPIDAVAPESPATADAHPRLRSPLAADPMLDVAGLCELPLTRAVVQYRETHEVSRTGRNGRDIGLAAVVSGRFASSVRALELGSGRPLLLDLSSELVALAWVPDRVTSHMARLQQSAAADPASRGELRRYGFALALRVLDRHGFTPVTRSTLLRIGFRDVCDDLDPHGEPIVRIQDAAEPVMRARLDWDAATLAFSSLRPGFGPSMERILRAAFPGCDVAGRRVSMGIPTTVAELLACLWTARRGLGALIAHYEPERYREVRRLMRVFGERATLMRLESIASSGAEPPDLRTRAGSAARNEPAQRMA